MNTASSKALKSTADQVGKITQGKLDVLIYNAYSNGSTEGLMLPPSGFTDKDAELDQELIDTLRANCTQVMYTVNTFLPIRQGKKKKIIYMTSAIAVAVAVAVLIRASEMPNLLGYAPTITAGNVLRAKYSVELKGDGISTLALSPGWVAKDAGTCHSVQPEVLRQKAYEWIRNSFRKVDPANPTTYV